MSRTAWTDGQGWYSGSLGGGSVYQFYPSCVFLWSLLETIRLCLLPRQPQKARFCKAEDQTLRYSDWA